ncbi:MAG: uncharacterized protein H6Q72_954 [Firmicutes bacterium]|nr:uncharacterized protein [Bacillota bacterium]
MDAKKAIKYYDRKFEKAKEVRQSYESTWEDIMTYIAPDLKGYLHTNNKDRGEREDSLIYDNTPTKSWLDCSSGMFASIASPSRPWMQRTMADDSYNDIPGLRSWLDTVTKKDYSILHRSNFYKCNYTVFAHLSAIGTALIICEPDYDKITHWTVPNIGEYYLLVNGKGIVDTVFREIEYTAEQLKGLFGEKALPKDIVNSITEANPTGGKYTVRHVIEPDSQGVVPFRKPWASVYYLPDKKYDDMQIIDVKGYKWQPFAAPRWYANNNETYGKMQPGRVSLGNCQQLSTMIFDYMDAVDQELNPATQGPPITGAIDRRPNKHNIIEPGAGGLQDPTIRRLFETNPQLQIMWAAIQDKREQIKQDFYLDLFMPITTGGYDTNMTATEVTQRRNERMLALGPVLENVNTEYLNPITEIEYNYATEAQAYPPIENYVTEDALEALQGEEIKTEYVSVLAQAQKMVDLDRIDTTLTYAERLAALDPTVVMKVNTMETIDEVAKMSGAPGRMLRSDDEVKEMQEQQRQDAEQQQMVEQAQAMANVAGQASKMQMDQDNALTRFLGVE